MVDKVIDLGSVVIDFIEAGNPKVKQGELDMINKFLDTNCSFSIGPSLPINQNLVLVLAKPTTSQSILSMFSYAITTTSKNRTFIEIYNVCTGKDQRKKGYSRIAFEKFFEEVSKTGHNITLWLGVKLDNAFVINVYANLGFSHPRLTNKSPTGKIHGFDFISLVRQFPAVAPSIPAQVVVSQSQKMIDAFISTTAPKIAYTLDMGDLEEMFKHVYSQDKFERGGELSLSFSNLKIKTHLRGPEGKFELDNPPAEFNYHTHPIQAYYAAEAVIGLPSIADMLHILNGTRAHFIFALEGIYVISVSPFFRQFMSFIRDYHANCKQYIDDIFSYYFSVEHSRGISVIEPTLSPSQMQAIANAMMYNKNDLTGISEDFSIKRKDAFHRLQKHFNSLNSKILFKKPKVEPKLIKSKLSPIELEIARKRAFECMKQFSDLEIEQIIFLDFISWEYVKVAKSLGKKIYVNIFLV